MSTQTSPIKTTREDRSVITIPEARPPRRWGAIAVVALAVVAALVLGAVAGTIAQRGAIRNRDAQVDVAQEAARAAAVAATDALARATDAAALVGGLRADLEETKGALTLLRARGHESAALVADMRARVVAIRERLSQVRHEGAVLTGPPLREGRYAVRLMAVGALQTPPRIVFDLGTWLRGRAARNAAIADGVIGPNGRLPHHRYFRNHTVNLRVMRAASDVRVSIRNRHGHPVFESSIVQLEDILIGEGTRARRVQRDPFWIVVRSGVVVSIQRQPYP